MTHGTTDPTAVVEFTDWEQVQAFAHAVCELTVPIAPPA